MCGIVGFVNRDIKKDSLSQFIFQSLVANSLRGTDGSGVAIVDKGANISWYKRPLPGWDLAQLSALKAIVAGAETPLYGIIHNRAGTNGGNSIDTSHPVISGHITLAHNGVITALYSLGGTLTHDSTAIAESMASRGEKETLELLQGSYALMWHNAKDNTLNVARNEQRPLYVGTVKGSSSLLFSSEDGLLLWLADRNEILLKSVSMLPPGMHTKIFADATIKSQASKFTIYSPPPIVYSAGASGYQVGRYTTLNKGDEFLAYYEGTFVTGHSRKEVAKFRHINDGFYSWVVPVDKGQQTKLVEKAVYRLRAAEDRVTVTNAANMDAELLSMVPEDTSKVPSATDQFYKPGDKVKFIPINLYSRGAKGAGSLIGVTEDTNMVEVRSFGVQKIRDMDCNSMYEGVVKSFIVNVKESTEYLLLDPNKIELITSGGVVNNCGWCDAHLTAREMINNAAPAVTASGALCDVCYSHYAQSLGGMSIYEG